MATASKRAKASSSERPTTDRTRYIILLGNRVNHLLGQSFPQLDKCCSTHLVLKRNSFIKHPINVFIKQAVKEVLPFWNMAGIKTIQQQNAEKKLQNIWQN